MLPCVVRGVLAFIVLLFTFTMIEVIANIRAAVIQIDIFTGYMFTVRIQTDERTVVRKFEVVK